MEVNINARRNVTDCIAIRSWQVLGTCEQKKYLYKTWFNEASYEILITDGLKVWRELLDEKSFIQKCKKLNPNIEATPSDFAKYVHTGFTESIKRNTMTIKEAENTTEVSFKSKLMDTIPFSWKFELCAKDMVLYTEQLLHPLFVVVKELCRRQSELEALLEKKDREIQDYKDHGATVSRRHLETIPFERRIFESTNNLDEAFIASCTSDIDVTVLCEENIKDMYQNVLINKQCVTMERREPANQQTDGLPTFDTAQTNNDIPSNPNLPSWEVEGRLPVSVVKDNEDPMNAEQSQYTRPTTEQDKEKERREALRKRLEEETEKKQKKKKRKFNI